MNLHFDSKYKFQNFKIDLKERLLKREKSVINKPDFRPSAVMILFMNKNDKAHVFLTRRTQKVSTHKGEVAFPGGACEESDKSLFETGLRETYEEVGIIPKDIEFLGEFDEFFSIRNFHVSTFVGAINYPYKYKINRDEIDDYIEAPLSIFYNREFDKVDNYQYEGKNIEIFYYSYADFIIWGLTARILTDLADKVLKNNMAI